MPATATQVTRFRFNIGDSDFDSTIIDALFDEALEVYPNGSEQLLMAYAMVKGIQGLIASSARRVNYTEGSASEDLSDISKALKGLLSIWLAELEEQSVTITPFVKWGSISKFPSRIKEWPDG